MEDFERWYQREHPRVLATGVALAGDLDAAREATDEAFARALERWTDVAKMTSPGGWVQVVALNHLRRSLRRRRREHRVAQAGLAASAPVVADMELWGVVAGLPSRQRTAVVLRYVHDLSEDAVAEVMGISRGTVASTLSAAKAALRRRLSSPPSRNEKDPTEETRR